MLFFIAVNSSILPGYQKQERWMRRLKKPSGYQDAVFLTWILRHILVTATSKVGRKDSHSMVQDGKPKPWHTCREPLIWFSRIRPHPQPPRAAQETAESRPGASRKRWHAFQKCCNVFRKHCNVFQNYQHAYPGSLNAFHPPSASRNGCLRGWVSGWLFGGCRDHGGGTSCNSGVCGTIKK